MKLLFENWRQYLIEDMGGFTAPYQLFIPRTCPGEKCNKAKLEDIPPVENNTYMNKPQGGLWTSTAFEKPDGESIWTSEWNEWMVSNMPHWMHPRGILMRTKTENVFHIENDADAEMLYEEFPLENSDHPQKKIIDFEAALQKYDGIHWGLKSGKHSKAYEFGRSGMWDMESTVWRDASVLDAEKVVNVFYPESEEKEEEKAQSEQDLIDYKEKAKQEIEKAVGDWFYSDDPNYSRYAHKWNAIDPTELPKEEFMVKLHTFARDIAGIKIEDIE